MASIKSIQDILSTYQQAYGAEALMAELALFQKSKLSATALLSSLAPSKKVVVVKKSSAPASAEAPSSSASSVASEAKEKKVRGPSAWNVYIEKVAGKGKDETPEFSAWKTLQVEKKGNLKMVFAKEQKAADPEGYKSFAEAFERSAPAPAPAAKPSAPAPKASVPSSSASVSSEGSEKKKAGRPKGSKNKAKDAESVKAESSDSEGEKPKEGEKKKRQWSEEAKKANAAKRAAKKAAESGKKATEAANKPLPESDDEAESEAAAEMSSILYEGENLFWNELTGQTYENIDGAMGDLVGTFDGITLTRV